jgi:COMPASS component SWD1
VLWDLKDGSRLRTIILDGPVWSADLHPHDQYTISLIKSELSSLCFVASVVEANPLLVDLHGTTAKRYILPTTLPTLSTAEEDVQVTKTTEYTLVSVFDRTGKYIYTGTSRGHFNVIDAETREVFATSIVINVKKASEIISFVYRRN